MADFVAYLYDSGGLRTSVAIAVAWSVLLSRNEVLSLRRKDIALDGDALASECGPGTAVVLVYEAKTGDR